MGVFETILGVLLAAVLLSLLARRIKVPYPALLAIGGAVAAFLPFAPRIEIEPELVLALFVAPVLLDAAFDSSVRDLKRNAVPIAFLGVAAVAVTVAAVAVVAKWLRPDLPWAAAIALGAIVAPPDAAAATAVLRAIPVPHRIKVILEGESLFNDATALIVYRLAVGAVGTSAIFGWDILPALALATVGSVVFALVTAFVVIRLLVHVRDAPSAILLQFITTFGVWIAAELLHLSAIVAIVIYALASARLSARRTSADVRAPAYAVWQTVVFGLNALAFALVGLQVGPIVREVGDELPRYLMFAGAVTAVVIGVRIIWVMGYNSLVRLKNALFGENLREEMEAPSFASGAAIAWAGMRGVVTLAVALALPSGFPERDLLLFTAFAVVLVTLVGQGLTLGPLLKALKLPPDDVVAGETRLAREAVARAALAALEGEEGEEAELLRDEYEERLAMVTDAEAKDGDARPDLDVDALRLRVLEAKREALHGLRTRGDIGDDAYFQLEEELDRFELSLTPVER